MELRQYEDDTTILCQYLFIITLYRINMDYENINKGLQNLQDNIQLGKTSKKKNCRFGENGTIGGEGVRNIIEFSSFTNDEKHGRGGVSE